MHPPPCFQAIDSAPAVDAGLPAAISLPLRVKKSRFAEKNPLFFSISTQTVIDYVGVSAVK